MSYCDIISKYLEKRDTPLQCIPVKGKAPFTVGWDSVQVTDDVIEAWDNAHGAAITGLGFRLGQYKIGCMDVDTNDPEYIYRIDETMDLAQVCVKKGMKGKTVFFRYIVNPPKSTYKIFLRDGDKKPLVEFFFDKMQTVLPPSIHPDTGSPYIWLSEESLLDIDIEELPVIDFAKLEHLQTILRAGSFQEGLKLVPTSVVGEGSGKHHTMTSQARRLLNLGFDESSIAKTLVGHDRQLHPNAQFFFSKKIGKDLISKTDDLINAISWIATFKANVMRTSPELQKALSYHVKVAETVDISPNDFGPLIPILNKQMSAEYPEDLFPESFREHCFDHAKMANMPAEAHLMALFVVFSSICQGKFTLHAKTDFETLPGISGIIVAPSGSKKDTLFAAAKRPLIKLIKRDISKLGDDFIEHQKDIAAQIENASKFKKKALVEKDDDVVKIFNEEIFALQNKLKLHRKKKPNFIFESGSQEMLYKIMHENQDRGIFLCNPELVQLTGNMNKSGNEALRGFFLKALNSSPFESFSHQTIAGLSVDIDKVFGCSLVGVQSDVFAQEIKKMESGIQNDGLFQRYLIINVNPEIKRMSDDGKKINSDDVDNLFALIYDLEGQHHVYFTPEAKEYYIDYEHDMALKCKNDSSAIKSFRSKYSGTMVRLAFLYQQADNPRQIVKQIELKYAMKATRVLEWQSRSLDVTWSNTKYSVTYRNAMNVLDSIGTLGSLHPQVLIPRRGEMNATEIKNVVDLLIDHNYLRRVGTKFELNPLVGKISND